VIAWTCLSADAARRAHQAKASCLPGHTISIVRAFQLRPSSTRPFVGSAFRQSRSAQRWSIFASILVSNSSADAVDMPAIPMLARIGVMKALNRHVERVFNPDRKEVHWGKRKLKRDQ
jgi:hypothetical protein